jgi:hypothetical protein
LIFTQKGFFNGKNQVNVRGWQPAYEKILDELQILAENIR